VFAIELRSRHDADDGDGGGTAEASGLIVIGDFTETFKAPRDSGTNPTTVVAGGRHLKCSALTRTPRPA
jgi:hypothetical protein